MVNYCTTLISADNGGCSHYRMRFPAWTMRSVRKGNVFNEVMQPNLDPKSYNMVRSIVMQRQASEPMTQYITEFLTKISQVANFWMFYEIDDVITHDGIPTYNANRHVFENPKVQSCIRKNMNACDYITTTTEELAKLHSKYYDIPIEKFVIIPNYVPKWWMGGIYNEEKISTRFDSMEKPHIVFPCSSSHYDHKNINNGNDDFTHIIDFVIDNLDNYKFTFIGGIPQQLKPHSDKIRVHSGFDILNYPKGLDVLNPDILIAPLQDNVFNRCKSNIKWIESSVMGIPCICQNLPTYSKYTNLTFKDCNSLQNQIDSLLDKKTYMNVVRDGYDRVANGDSKTPNGWLMENNLDKWAQVYDIPQKQMTMDLRILKRVLDGMPPAPVEMETTYEVFA